MPKDTIQIKSKLVVMNCQDVSPARFLTCGSFIYIHVMKTGGNTFQSFLQGALCDNPVTNSKYACRAIPAFRNTLEYMTCAK